MKKLKVANSKYNALSSWLTACQSNPSSTGSSGQASSNPRDSEDGSKMLSVSFGRQDTDLAKYASDAEEVRLGYLLVTLNMILLKLH